MRYRVVLIPFPFDDLSGSNWFFDFDTAAWDKQFEEDVAAGRLDALADEAIRRLSVTKLYR